jgi:hypothetical protein
MARNLHRPTPRFGTRAGTDSREPSRPSVNRGGIQRAMRDHNRLSPPLPPYSRECMWLPRGRPLTRPNVQEAHGVRLQVGRSGEETQDRPPDGVNPHIHFSACPYDHDLNEEQAKQVLQPVVGQRRPKKKREWSIRSPRTHVHTHV